MPDLIEVTEAAAIRRAPDGLPVPIDRTQPIDPLVLVDKAIERGVDVSQLGQLVELAEKMQKAQAAREFAVAVSSAQAEFPTVFKRRTATIKAREGGRDFHYQFASYDDVMREVGPVLAKHKIALNFSTEPGGGPGLLKVTCRVRVGTHYEDHTLTVPVPSQMVVNDTQKFGAALKYAQRYALCAAMNVVVTDEDNDAEALVDTITQDQAKELDKLMLKKGVNVGKFLRWAQIDPWAHAADKDLPATPEDVVGALMKMPTGTLAKAFDELRRRPDVQK